MYSISGHFHSKCSLFLNLARAEQIDFIIYEEAGVAEFLDCRLIKSAFCSVILLGTPKKAFFKVVGGKGC